MSRQKRTFALDFDGVLHEYAGYREGLIQGPIPGAREAVDRLLSRGHTLVVFTTRPAALVQEWLARHGFPPLEVTNQKRPFFVILDDRAVNFTGTWDEDLVRRLEQFRPHWWARAGTAAAPGAP